MGTCNTMSVACSDSSPWIHADGQLSANHARRMAFLSLDKGDKELYEEIGFKDKLEAVDEGIRRYVHLLLISTAR